MNKKRRFKEIKLNNQVFHIVARFWYMGKAVRLERIFYKGEQQKEQTRLTQVSISYLGISLHAICVVTLALWIPAAILVGWQWLPLLIYGYRPHVPPALVLIASISSEAATSVPVLCFLAGDERIRAALLGRMRKHYALLQPERAKRYNRA
uniref:SFRICE_019447 n=1 Tax=Spodoptera frugiperda TaxID=7108 RepID=A0A2H1WLK4_SPOFR